MRACDYYVFKIIYKTTFAERAQSAPGEDFQLTGRRLTEQRNYLCVAPEGSFAMAAFNGYHSRDEFISITNIGKLDDLVYLQ